MTTAKLLPVPAKNLADYAWKGTENSFCQDIMKNQHSLTVNKSLMTFLGFLNQSVPLSVYNYWWHMFEGKWPLDL